MSRTTPDVTPEMADRAIFRGDFDHWDSVTVRPGPVVACGVDGCDYNERVSQVCRRPQSITGPGMDGRDATVVGTFALQLHLSKRHLDEVINALESRT